MIKYINRTCWALAQLIQKNADLTGMQIQAKDLGQD